MAEAFDAYYKWLGIAPKDQPPNHYRLLGIEAFTDDADVIAHAADRQMAHLRSLQAGPHGALSQKLLNEIAAARVCLLNREKKAAYDARLRQQLSVAASTSAGGTPAAGGAGPAGASAPVAPRLPTAAALHGQPVAARPVPPARPTPHSRPQVAVTTVQDSSSRGRLAKRGGVRGIGVVAVGVVVLVALVVVASSLLREPTAPQRAGVQPPAKPPESVAQGPPARRAPPEPEPTVPPDPPMRQPVTSRPNPTTTVPTPPPTSDPNPSQPPVPPPATNPLPAVIAGPSEPIDLFSLVDLEKDVVGGVWLRERDGWLSAAGPGGSKLVFPCVPTGSYQLEIDFTRQQGTECLAIGLPTPVSRVLLVISGHGRQVSGIGLIRGRTLDNNGTERDGRLENGRRYTLTVRMLVRGEEVSIECDMDGAEYLRWRGPAAHLGDYPDWAWPGKRTLAVGTNNTEYLLHHARLRMLDGQLRLLRGSGN